MVGHLTGVETTLERTLEERVAVLEELLEVQGSINQQLIEKLQTLYLLKDDKTSKQPHGKLILPHRLNS